MDIKISEKVEKPLLSRIELTGEVHFDASTPSRAELRKKVAEALKVAEELVVIRVIDNCFGQKKAVFKANAYKTKGDLDRNESMIYLMKGVPREKKQKEAKPKAK